MRAPLVFACLLAALNVSAQGTAAPAKPNAKAPSTRAPGKPSSIKVPPSQTPGTTTNTRQATTAVPPGANTKQPTKPLATRATPAPIVAPVIMREAFDYNPQGRRDPFFSLLTSSDLRPTVVDLRLTGILYDESGRNSGATMRDLSTGVMYKVQVGQLLGRMRVAMIKRSAVIFSIEEFGVNRQDSVVLRDTTKARVK